MSRDQHFYSTFNISSRLLMNLFLWSVMLVNFIEKASSSLFKINKLFIWSENIYENI